MARAPSVSYPEFKRAFFRLISTKAAATYDDLHKELGGTCSRTTIQNYRNRCLQELKEKGLNVLPESLPQELVPLVDELWAQALHKAGDAWANEKDSLEHSLRASAVELSQKGEEITQLQTLLGARDRQIEESQLRISGLEGRLEDARKLSEQKNLQVNQLSEQLSRDRVEHERALADAVAAFDQDREAWAREREHLRTELQAALKREESEHARNLKQVDHWIMQVDQERTRVLNIEDERKRDRKRFDDELLLCRKREESMSIKFSAFERKVQELEDTRDKLLDEIQAARRVSMESNKEHQAVELGLKERLAVAQTTIGMQKDRISELLATNLEVDSGKPEVDD